MSELLTQRMAIILRAIPDPERKGVRYAAYQSGGIMLSDHSIPETHHADLKALNLEIMRRLKSSSLMPRPDQGTCSPCKNCGSVIGVHAHHDDYSKPLDVMWLCPLHHKERHKELSSGLLEDCAATA
jgi:hypothetical protein